MSTGQWRKRGRIYVPDGSLQWMRTHAASPVPLLLQNNRIRVLVSGRDERSRARIGSIEFSLDDPSAVSASALPVADLGAPGTFDENGMVAGCAVEAGGRLYIYYSGFQRGTTVPFWFFGGLLLSDDFGLTANRASQAPVLDRNNDDPIIAGAPWILREGELWRMWYTAGTHWEGTGEDLRHFYHIKYAESNDGLNWHRTGRVAIDFRDGEYALGRPCVIRDRNRYRMWYSRRGSSYRIGYAESADGLTWERRDDLAGIDVSPDGWDSEMIEYAAVFERTGKRWMLYNGNGYGKSGLGLAEWVPE